jgi:hypothetical protein
MGTGRCGTASASFLFNSQKSALFTHELFPILPWEEERQRSIEAKRLMQFKFNQMTHQCHNYDLVGDAGTYYLPYVEVLIRSLQKIDDFDLSFVVMKRDKSATVKSFLKKFETQNNNPLQNHNGPKNEWDLSFPKYDGVSLESAVEKYYDDYYARSEALVEKFPKFVKIFDTKDLNSEKGLRNVFAFLKIDEPLIITNIKKNSSTKQ